MTLIENHETSSSHVAELALRCYRAGEFAPEACAEVDRHLASCPACRAKMRALVEEQRSFERETPFERFAGGIERAQRVPRQRLRRAWAVSVSGVIAAAALALFAVRVSSPGHNQHSRVKGSSVEATARIASVNASAQRTMPPGSQEVLEPGDRVRLGYKIVDPRYLAAISVDDRGEVTPLYPEAGQALAVSTTLETVYLPDSLEFTGAGRERVFLFLARNPFELETAKQAVKSAHQAAKGDLSALPNPAFAGGQDVFSWLVSKAMTILRAIARAGPLLTLLLAMLPLVATPARAAGQHRFALIVGNDQGGADTRPLRFATEDARKVHAVLTQLGGVAPGDVTLMLNQPAGEFWRALGNVEARIAEAKQRGERALFILYYSGHAKNGELRLGESRIPLDALKARLSSAPVDIRIGVFDSCHSGVVTRTKGARRAPAFEIQAVGSEDTRGLVLLSSSSADEDAQESDDIGDSYFSHYLVSGLRGDADRSRDRRVTLSEAYAYAYARTVADTAESAAGAQHPTFSYDFQGNADLVLTDFASRREGIYVPALAPVGIYYIVDGNGFIAAEIQKLADGDRQIALPAGRYHVRRRLADRLRIGEIQIASGQLVTLDESRLRDAPFSDDPVKGAIRDEGAHLSLSLGGMMQSFFDGPTRDDLFPPTGMVGIGINPILPRDVA
jgi:Caspase domain